jgi:hypothetical protein
MYVLEYGDEDSLFVIRFNEVLKKLISSRKIAILGLVSPKSVLRTLMQSHNDLKTPSRC